MQVIESLNHKILLYTKHKKGSMQKGIEPKNESIGFIPSKYMLHNFLQFKQLFYDVVSKKYDVGADTDFWLYACRYLLMGDKEFICLRGPNGRNFSYKLIEEYNPKGLAAILKEKERVK